MSSDLLHEAMLEVSSAPKMDIKGKGYTQVATRLEIFRKHFGLDYSIITEVLPLWQENENLITVQAKIVNAETGIPVACGLAQEDKTKSKINWTSAMEVAETSAIGRALACLGLHGGEYASLDEMIGVGLVETVAHNEAVGQFVRDETDRKGRPSPPPEVSKYDFFVPQGNSQEDVEMMFEEIDKIDTTAELMAYYDALGETMQWLDVGDLKELKATFAARSKQLKGKQDAR